MSQALHPMLNTAIKAARSAGALINRASMDLDLLKVNTKSPNDFVTEVDHAAEATVIETLLSAYPGHGILAEESGRSKGAKDSEYVWIIDPLDGTTNFIHGFPVYCVSIALAVKGQVQQAVVYDPTRNDLFYASKGRGAFLNDKRLRVSKRIRLAECLVSTGFPFRKGDNFKRYLHMLEVVMPQCAGLRRPGAAALDLCYVAAGYCDGFFETGLSPWDAAAGALMVTEAGGLIGNFTGDSDFLYQREVVAGNPRVFGQLVTMLSPFTRMLKDDGHSAGGAATAGGAVAKAEAAPETTPEQLLAASLSATPPAAPASAPAKKAVRIRKAGAPASGDAPF
jgi:myo-inositol-1(or 4)-monophosphatase